MFKASITEKDKNIPRLFFVASGLVGILLYLVAGTANVVLDKPVHLLVIPRDCTLYQLRELLSKEKCIKNETTFLWTASILKYRPQDTPGLYRLTAGMNNWKMIRMLRGGLQYPTRITFSNTISKEELVEKVVNRIGLEKEALLSLLNDPEYLAAYGFSPENILTMFIPNTYEVYWTITAKQFFLKMHAAYQRFWNTQRLKQAESMGLSPIDVSILASIVQSETNNQQEAAIIAGVYQNRLKRNMRIESCPALIYLLKQEQGNLKRVLRKDTFTSSPYNCYRKQGLPPGPITFPSSIMIDAVLNYAQHDYLFFCAKEDFSGLHYFSRDYKEHLKKANKYKKALNAQKVMR
ncbi:endolytic transglycosylase MltG [Cardinium endosymbiont of Tipula unca]|uniref:endolytic transglycosylase MltG n=1 Tax=Cardinium endosymbiont of Tipula unca TaxID=3066216 RepID=UPI0030CE13BD